MFAKEPDPLAQDSNGDVDRAMAAFAASPMPYRNFAPGATEPVEAKRAPKLPAPDHQAPSDPMPDGMVAAAHSNKAERAAAFPLLMAALPNMLQSSLPRAPDTWKEPPEIPPAPGPGPSNMTPMMDQQTIQHGPRIHTPQTQPLQTQPLRTHTLRTHTGSTLTPEQNGIARRPVEQSPLGAPPRPTPAKRFPQQDPPALPKTTDRVVPMSSIFRILHATSPSPDDRTEAQSGLQDIFSRL